MRVPQANRDVVLAEVNRLGKEGSILARICPERQSLPVEGQGLRER
jgi:hypothetical protein